MAKDVNEFWKNLTKNKSSSKKPVTQRQLETLAKGRAKLAEKNEQKIASAYETLYKKELELKIKRAKKEGVKPDLDDIKYTYKQFKAEIEYRRGTEFKVVKKRGTNESELRSLTTKEIISSISKSKSYMTNDEIYVSTIKEYITGDSQWKIRKALSYINGTKYQATSINWEEFTLDGSELVHSSGKIKIHIRDGRDASLEPSAIVVDTNGIPDEAMKKSKEK